MPWNGIVTYDPASYYNSADINRQNQNIQYLQETLATDGYNVTLPRPITLGLTRKDFPTVSRIDDMRRNLNALMAGSYTPAGLPTLPQAPLTNVTWTNKARVTVNGSNGLVRDSSADSWNAGASSVEHIDGTGGSIEATITENNAHRMIGLSTNLDNNYVAGNYATLNFAIFFTATGWVEIYESGNGKPFINPLYKAGDSFKISVENSVVKYYQNGVVFYTSSSPLVYPLYACGALYTANSTLPNVKLVTQPTRKQKFGYVEANALEINMQGIYSMILNLESSFRYCGTFICGESGGLE